jgi:bacteriocin biosynthesis cyclodehydratase domain-containing protein
MLALLAAAGMLVDFPASLIAGLTDEQRPLLSELASTSLARMDSDGGAQIFARRSAATVQVSGSGRLAAAIAELLTASGLRPIAGQLTVPADKPSRPATRPALVVLAGPHVPGLADHLRRCRQPHLAVSAAEAIGTVGPLVRPGVTACLRCLDLHRAERDPAWPLILAQLAGRQSEPSACSITLEAAVAAQAAARVLDFVDRPAADGSVENATLELVQPDWQWRRRTWTPHPACICLATGA